MPLNKPKGNMYEWITKTWNPIRGACPHQCSYCYVKKSRVKRLYEGPPKLIKSQFKSLGRNNFWFIGSMIDLFAEGIPEDWIFQIIHHTSRYPDNHYLFQSKNPIRMFQLRWMWEPDSNYIFGTTIETNRHYSQMGKAPKVWDRATFLGFMSNKYFKTIVTIEPIMDFDFIELQHLIMTCNPAWVNIGADSQNSGLPEPTANKINELIKGLKAEGIEIKTKDNLKRLL